MNRRSFLKIIGVGAAYTALPVKILADTFSKEFDNDWHPSVKYDPEREYGSLLQIPSSEMTEPQWHELLKIMFTDMKNSIPMGSRFEIRKSIPTNFGRQNSVAWYHNPSFQRLEWNKFLEIKTPEYVYDKGFYLIGRGIL